MVAGCCDHRVMRRSPLVVTEVSRLVMVHLNSGNAPIPRRLVRPRSTRSVRGAMTNLMTGSAALTAWFADRRSSLPPSKSCSEPRLTTPVGRACAA
jgi:hypothetical protein